DKKNKLLTQLDYEPINTRRNFLSEGLVIFKNDKKYGFINLKGKVIIEAIYEEALPFKDGLAKVKLNNKYGFINTKGQVVIKIEYDYLSDMIENRVLFKNK
ncbi:WG repeat-containing protein, partial [Flavobacterium sp.]|uniref:WG repeat-containing protein n=1 Tax=Flavobacterium sp. TaxID=239 RepID=UPI0037C12120